ncbi:MAG: protein-glutamate O-methyltransferase CheR [Acidobacteria bacterium]|nr:protein-glutamate O-methyltransferase CheR [Acidobacteriota bacterium]
MIRSTLQPKALSGAQSSLSPIVLTHRDFALISALAHEEFGIELGPGKEQLVAARVGKLMRRLSFSSFREFYGHLQADRTGQCLTQLIDSLTTNHTSFFREQAHFAFLVQHVFPAWESSRPMRIWSAACSTGEEPYTIALIANEHFQSRRQPAPHILASDISTHALDTAQKGAYPAQRLQHALAPWLRKHLLRGEGQWDGWYRMRPEIMDMVEFRRINLIHPLPDIGRFDVIFCRNVMIYFSHQTQAQLVSRLAACLEPGGYLLVGHSETLTGIQHGLQHVQPAIYRKRGASK